MRGKHPTIKDINIELHSLVLPQNLLCGEELVEEEEEEEEQEEQDKCPYRVVTDCRYCQKSLCMYVVATDEGIRTFEQQLCGNLDIVCPSCARQRQRNGGQRH
ncbi:E7 [Gammapapillomavirus 6]|uniref:Protein E7 n=1 Tax=Gammapapillomavirus 6 TaxID=1175848 RepID=A0A2D2AL77_9PAPI|nr:E7 [Gammapapillomavirus 6]